MPHSCLVIEVFDESAGGPVLAATWVSGGIFTAADRLMRNEIIVAVVESRRALDGADVVVRVLVAAGDARVNVAAVTAALAAIGFKVPPGEYRPGAWVKAVRI